MASLESWMLLASGEAEDVLMVFADEPLPAPYQQEHALPQGGLALALRLALPSHPAQAEGVLGLDWGPGDTLDAPAATGGPAACVATLSG